MANSMFLLVAWLMVVCAPGGVNGKHLRDSTVSLSSPKKQTMSMEPPNQTANEPLPKNRLGKNRLPTSLPTQLVPNQDRDTLHVREKDFYYDRTTRMVDFKYEVHDDRYTIEGNYEAEELDDAGVEEDFFTTPETFPDAVGGLLPNTLVVNVDGAITGPQYLFVVTQKPGQSLGQFPALETYIKRSDQIKDVHHSNVAPVDLYKNDAVAAGEFVVAPDHTFTFLSGRSGHYMCDPESFRFFIFSLKDKGYDPAFLQAACEMVMVTGHMEFSTSKLFADDLAPLDEDKKRWCEDVIKNP